MSLASSSTTALLKRKGKAAAQILSSTATASTTTTSIVHSCGWCNGTRPLSTAASSGSTSQPIHASSSNRPALVRTSSTASSKPTKSSTLIRPVRLVPPKLTKPNSEVYKERKQIRGVQKPVTLTQREQDLAKLFALQSYPPISAFAALANRISPELLGHKSEKDKEGLLRLLEQCCVCDSFWKVVAEEEGKAALQDTQSSSTSPAKQYTNFLDKERVHNESLSVLGNSLLGVFALEWLESRYPHLPERVLKAALTLYVGPRTCADIATKQWGLNSGQASRQAFLPVQAGPSAISPSHKPGQPLRGAGEGSRAGTGLLRWGRTEASKTEETLAALANRLSGSSSSKGYDERDNRTPLPLEEALATATRAIVGLIFQEHGFATARKFVHETFLTRQADIAALLKFPNPKYTLSATLQKYNRAPATTRLIAETGRLSIAPIFITGVYSDKTKLGEGYGSSLQMAEFRACEDALRRIYLSPLERTDAIDGQQDADGQASHSAIAELELPSDTLVFPGRRLAANRRLADDEVIFQSSGRSGTVVV